MRPSPSSSPRCAASCTIFRPRRTERTSRQYVCARPPFRTTVCRRYTAPHPARWLSRESARPARAQGWHYTWISRRDGAKSTCYQRPSPRKNFSAVRTGEVRLTAAWFTCRGGGRVLCAGPTPERAGERDLGFVPRRQGLEARRRQLDELLARTHGDVEAIAEPAKVLLPLLHPHEHLGAVVAVRSVVFLDVHVDQQRRFPRRRARHLQDEVVGRVRALHGAFLPEGARPARHQRAPSSRGLRWRRAELRTPGIFRAPAAPRPGSGNRPGDDLHG